MHAIGDADGDDVGGVVGDADGDDVGGVGGGSLHMQVSQSLTSFFRPYWEHVLSQVNVMHSTVGDSVGALVVGASVVGALVVGATPPQ